MNIFFILTLNVYLIIKYLIINKKFYNIINIMFVNK